MNHPRYFRIEASGSDSKRWFLQHLTDEDGHEIDSRKFMSGKSYSGAKPQQMRIEIVGEKREFNMADMGVPVVSESILNVFLKHEPDAIVFYPITVANECWYLMNLRRSVYCFDFSRSQYELWQEEDFRKDLYGQLKGVYKMQLDASLIPLEYHIFVVKEWDMAIIVSEKLKYDLQAIPNHGMSFQRVS